MLEIYQASVKNVRELKSSRKKLKQIINLMIKNKKKDVLPILTKNYALLYSSFAETCFLKMIHTPYGFSDSKIIQITSKRNLEEKWEKSIELAFMVIDNGNGEFKNKIQTLKKLIQKYIIEPSHLRNKIAHGQWAVALNSDNTAINSETTERVKSLDFVKIDILFEIYEKISQVVEDLIESPKKAHFRDFYLHLTELETFVIKTKKWTLDSKIKVLMKKFDRQESIKS